MPALFVISRSYGWGLAHVSVWGPMSRLTDAGGKPRRVQKIVPRSLRQWPRLSCDKHGLDPQALYVVSVYQVAHLLMHFVGSAYG